MDRDDEKLSTGESVSAVSPKATTTTATLLEHSRDGDEALQAFRDRDAGEVIEIDEATNRRLLRKIDWNMMPVGASLTLLCSPLGAEY
nr:hypothetical protein CFP56_71444 [Quercus suber]